MGIDDAIKFHERVGTAFKTLLSRSVESSGANFNNGNNLRDALQSYEKNIIKEALKRAKCIKLLSLENWESVVQH